MPVVTESWSVWSCRQPYVSFPGVTLGASCLTGCEAPTLELDPDSEGIIPEFEWRVGGAVKVDETQVRRTGTSIHIMHSLPSHGFATGGREVILYRPIYSSLI